LSLLDEIIIPQSSRRIYLLIMRFGFASHNNLPLFGP
jgi:hypothetical protein